ncbi:MAG: 6-hydroxymethylpterin diphosphokinase MptE-like protein [Candidatus Caldarchaeum sp.]
MKLEEWLKLYAEICMELGIDRSRDYEAAQLLSNMIKQKHLSREHLTMVFKRHAWAVVFGAGPSLEKDIDEFLEKVGAGSIPTVAADGACRAFLERGVTPDVVVTDLDGGDEALVEAAEKGSLLVVHAHGDNIDRIKLLIPNLPAVVGTTQTEPVGVLENFGGFTDGDRAVYMCEELGVRNIVMAGMDFDGEIGKYSKPAKLSSDETARKRKKLSIAKKLLTHLAENTEAKLYDASASSGKVDGFEKVGWSYVETHVKHLKIHSSRK